MRRTRAFERARRIIATSILLSLALPAVRVCAEENVSDPKDAASGTRSKVNLNEVEIHGDLEKPKIFFILPKAKRDAQAKQRQFRFYPDILEPLDKDRFEEEARVLYQHGIPAE
jgi:hypothetical protein